MALQMLPIIKAVAPYLTQIATVAIPAFTSKPTETAKNDPLIAKQIEELQQAATQNAQSIHVLAGKLQQVVEGVEEAARDAKRQVAAYKIMLFAALALSCVSIVFNLMLVLR